MKKLIITIILLAALLFIGLKYAHAAPCSVLQGCTGRGTTTTVLQSNGLVPQWVATSTLGFVGGSSATTTINSVQGPTFTFLSANPSLVVSTSTATVTLTVATSTIQGLITGTAPISASAGVISCPTCVTNSYASSTFVTYGYGTSTYATIANYPSYTYGTATYATILNYPSYSYASSTFPSFTYASSSYATLWNLKAGTNITISTSTGVTIDVSLHPVIGMEYIIMCFPV
jgi:hypothetical protein